MSDNENDVFGELTDFSNELKDDEAYYGYPYNRNNPRFNLNLVSSETLDDLIHDMIEVLSTAAAYKADGWELTEPVHFGKIQLHYNRDDVPERKGNKHE